MAPPGVVKEDLLGNAPVRAQVSGQPLGGTGSIPLL